MKKYIFLATIIIALYSCDKESIRGNGNTVIQGRSITDFTSVQANADIKLHISYGATQKVEVKGYENLIGITETNVTNNKLTVKYKSEYNNIKNSNIELFIVIPVLNGVGTNGSGDVWIDGFTNSNLLDASINGSSNINISNSSYENVILNVNGSGNIRASGLISKNTDATIHGSGDIEISCSQNLRARIYGSGDIKYWGGPGLDVEINGSGRVVRQ